MEDAIGGVQAGSSEAADWSGSSIQLECGEYTTLRFHIRFFGAGDWTIANAHLDVLIPGTTDHEVLSWELGETLVMVDMLRTGLLDPASPLGASGPITAAPSYRTINPLIYNGLPSGLITLIGGPPAPWPRRCRSETTASQPSSMLRAMHRSSQVRFETNTRCPSTRSTRSRSARATRRTS